MFFHQSGTGVYPKFGENLERAYLFDEGGLGGVDVSGNGNGLVQYLTVGMPAAVFSDLGGRARRFLGSSVLYDSATNLAATLQGDFTLFMRLNWTAIGADFIFEVSGPIDVAGTPNNSQFGLGINGDGNYLVQNEAASIQQKVFTDYTIVTSRVHNLMIRGKAGAASGRAYEFWVNGKYLGDTADMQTPTDGSAATLQIGARRYNVGVNVPAFCDVHACMLWSRHLSQDEIEDAQRRTTSQSYPTQTWSRVDIEDPSSVMVDMTTKEGINWVKSASITEALEQPAATANVDLLREVDNYSLALLKTDSKLNLTNVGDPTTYGPLVDVNREIEIFVARKPLFVKPSSGDWESRFYGVVDSVDWGGEKVSLSCRDMGARLVDTYIETENPYGTTATQTLEATIQQILDDNDNSVVTGSYDPVTLLSPVASQWILNIQDADSGQQLLQRRETVMSAVRTLAGQIGWEVKYKRKHDPTGKEWRLTLFEPERIRGDSDHFLASDDISDVSRLSVSAQNTRSDIRVVYPSREASTPTPVTLPVGVTEIDRGWAGVDGRGNPVMAYIHVANTAARARYGRRFMEMAEASTSQIDTIHEAAQMASAVCLDLSEPEALYEISTPSRWELEPNDILQMGSNELLHTGSQTLSIQSVTHDFGSSNRSTFRMRGKPAVGFKRWMDLGTYPGQSRPPTLDPYHSLQDQTIGQLFPVVAALIQRTDYFGNNSKYLNLPNGNFNLRSRGIFNPPDKWEYILNAGSEWSDGDIGYSSTSRSGGASVRFVVEGAATDENKIFSDFIPLPDGDESSLAIEWTTARDGAGAGESYIVVQMYQYDGDRNFLSAISLIPESTINDGQGVWVTRREEGLSPATGAKYARIKIGPPSSAAVFQVPMLLDRVDVYALSDEVYASCDTLQDSSVSTTPSFSQGTWHKIFLDNVVKDYGDIHEHLPPIPVTRENGYETTIKKTGSYDLSGSIEITYSQPSAASQLDYVACRIQAYNGTTWTTVAESSEAPGVDTSAGAKTSFVAMAGCQTNGVRLERGWRVKLEGKGTVSGGIIPPDVMTVTADQNKSRMQIKLRQTE